jgi:hypothetical protein
MKLLSLWVGEAGNLVVVVLQAACVLARELVCE